MKNKDKYDLRRLHYFVSEGTIDIHYRPRHVAVEIIGRETLPLIVKIPRDGTIKSELIGEWLESEC